MNTIKMVPDLTIIISVPITTILKNRTKKTLGVVTLNDWFLQKFTTIR